VPSPDDSWSDEDAGPVVRPYVVISGRTKPSSKLDLDLLAIITATWRAPAEPWTLNPEHFSVLRICASPVSLADLASDLHLPLGVVKILVTDLSERDLVTVRAPRTIRWQDDLPILREVLNDLREL
jgi:hypothetical protein